MKNIITKFTTAAAILFTAASTLPEAQATNVTIDGGGFYSVRNIEGYHGNGVTQSGRYTNLGSGYYHNTNYGMDFLTNHSSYTSGSMSFEFWAMPYYKATTGIILMTRYVDPLTAYTSNPNISRFGSGVALNANRFPEIDLWELTSSVGWKFRSAFRFTVKDWL